MTALETRSGQPLPDGWRWVKLGEVCRVFAGSAAPQGKDYFSSDGPFFFRVSDIGRFGRTMNLIESQDRLSSAALTRRQFILARKGAVLFPKSGAAITNNNRALLDVDGYIVSHLMALEPTDMVLSEWLYYTTCRVDMMDFSDNAGYPSLKQSVVEKIQIPLPPLADQQRIVGVLRQQMAAVEKTRAAAQARLAAVKALPAAFLRQVFPQPSQPLPNGWRWVRLGNVLQETRNGLYKPDTFYGTGTRILRMYNIGRLDGSWDLKHVDLIELTADEKAIYSLDEGDILFNRVNSNELVGKCAVIDSRTAGSVFESKNIRLRLNYLQADPWFVATFLNSQGGRNQIKQRLKQIVGQATVNRSDLDSFEIPLASLPEQRRIAGMLKKQMAAVEKARVSAEAELAAIDALPAALLRRAFSGEL